MTSKQRVFSHSIDINYNDYIKNKNGIEILKNIKNNHGDHHGNHHSYNPNNIIIKKFANHQDLINFTKTYYNYVNLNKYSLKATKDLYNSNISIVDVNVKVNNNFKNENNDCNDCDSCDNSKYYNGCLKLSQVLYPDSYYVSNNLPEGVYLHFNLDLNKWCVNKTLLDYNKIYNFHNNIINIDGFNGCANNDECYNLQSVSNSHNNHNDNEGNDDDDNEKIQDKPTKPTKPTKPKKPTKLKSNTKCRTGMCGNAKPLFI